jgi:hypothetical protein
MVARRHHQSRLRRRPALIARPCRATDRVKKSLTRGRGAASLKDSRRESSRSPFAAAGAQRTDASVLSLVQHVSRLLPAQIADEPTLCCASPRPWLRVTVDSRQGTHEQPSVRQLDSHALRWRAARAGRAHQLRPRAARSGRSAAPLSDALGTGPSFAPLLSGIRRRLGDPASRPRYAAWANYTRATCERGRFSWVRSLRSHPSRKIPAGNLQARPPAI